MWVSQDPSTNSDSMFVRNCDMKRKWTSRFVTSWLSEKSTWLWTTQLLPLQNIQFLTAWLPEDCFEEKECSLPDFVIVGNLNLKSEHQISGRMLIRNLVQHGTESAFSDSHLAKYLPLLHKGSTENLKTTQFCPVCLTSLQVMRSMMCKKQNRHMLLYARSWHIQPKLFPKH